MVSLAVFKALHLIFVVTWFAGLFYIVRLLVYHVEALESDQGAGGQILAQQLLSWKGVCGMACLAQLCVGPALWGGYDSPLSSPRQLSLVGG